MFSLLLEPFHYNYMIKAMFVSAGIGATCAFLSAYLILKGWSLIGDALSHSVVPGVAGAYALGLPYAFGAFFSGFLAAACMAFIKHVTRLKEDAIIGFVFSTFFALGLLMISLNPTAVNVQLILFGKILGIADDDVKQISLIIGITFIIMLFIYRDLIAIFFDENHAASIGLPILRLKLIFFTLLSACTVAALQTVGAILVIAMVITPGATAYLITNRFHHLVLISIMIGAVTCALGAYLSYFMNGATSGVIVTLQTGLFILTFIVAPQYGLLAQRYKRKQQIIKAS